MSEHNQESASLPRVLILLISLAMARSVYSSLCLLSLASLVPSSLGLITCPGFPGYCSESFPGQSCNVVCGFGRNNVPLCQVSMMILKVCSGSQKILLCLRSRTTSIKAENLRIPRLSFTFTRSDSFFVQFFILAIF